MRGASTIPKLADVARLAGVGNATVSRALNGNKSVSKDAKARVDAAVLQLKYRPNRIAQSLKGRSSGMIGMIVPTISDAFFSQCAEAVEEVARKRGSLLVVLSAHDKSEMASAAIQQLLMHNVDGLILANSLLPSPTLVQELRQLRVPVVGIDAPLKRTGLPSVLCQNFEGALMATNHLLWHGYQTILCVQVKPSLYTQRERLRGYCASLSAAGRNLVTEIITGRDSAETLLRQYVDHKRPVAIFAGNNLAAQHLCTAASRMQIGIPQELAIISFDDFDLADTLTPPMSVIRQPTRAIGHLAATLLFRRLRSGIFQDEADDEIMLAPELVVRGSCGCPSGGILPLIELS